MLRTAAIAIGLAAFSTFALAQDAPPLEFDFARLAHPKVAKQLELTDEQRASIGRLLNARANALTTTSDEGARRSFVENSNRELSALLSEQQRELVSQLDEAARLRFSFQGQKWSGVLQWVAEQADMTLVYDRIPDEQFSYRDNRNYSVGEAIDLLNGVLLTKGYTLIRRDKLLILAELSQKIPNELLPEVTIESLPKYGQFELVRMRIPLGGRSVDAVEKEVRPIVSQFGQVSILPQSRQLLVTETASKVAAINRLVAAIPEPKKPKPKPEPKPKKEPPKPSLQVYSIKNVDPNSALATVKTLMGDDIKSTIDRQASTISFFAVPSQQTAIKSVLDKLMDGSQPGQQARLQTFEVRVDNEEVLKTQIKLAAPNSQVTVDKKNQKLMVFGSPVELAQVAAALESEQLGTTKQTIEAYPFSNSSDLDSVVEMLQSVAPDATVASSKLTSSIVVRAHERDQEQINSLIEQLDQQERNQPAFASYDIDESLSATATTAIEKFAPNATVNWDPANKRLLVQATPLDHQQIRTLIDTFVGTKTDKSFKTYVIAVDQQSNLTNAIQKAVPNATVTWDAQNKRLVGYATSDAHDQIQATIESLQVEREKPVPKTYQIDPEQRTSLSQAIGKQVPDASTTWDDANERLVVYATNEDHAQVQSVIDSLQVERQAPTLKTIAVDASEQSTIIATLSKIVPDAQVSWDAANRRLVVLANEENHVNVAKTIATLATEDNQTSLLRVYSFPPKLQTRVTALIPTIDGAKPPKVVDDTQPGEIVLLANSEQHSQLVELLEQLKKQDSSIDKLRLGAFPIVNADVTSLQGVIAELFPNTKVIIDAEASRLMVWATTEQQTVIGQAVKQLDVEKTSNVREQLRAYEAPGLEITSLTASLSKQFPSMVLSFDRQNSKIMAWGNEKSHEKLAATIETLAKANPPKTTSVKIYPTTPRTANEVLPILSKTVTRAWLAADQQSETIIARATTEEHQLIQATLDQLPAIDEASGDRTLVAYETSASRAYNVENLLQRIAPQATISRTRGSNELLVFGSKNDHAKIDKALSSLRNDPKNPKSIQVYKSIPATTANLAELISNVTPRAQITGRTSNQLTVWATSSDHKQIAKLAEQLSSETKSPGTTVRTYPIENVSSRDLIELLSPDLDANTTATVSADRDRLIVRATAVEHDRLSNVIPVLVKQLESERPNQSVRTFALQGTPGASVLDMIREDLPSQASARVSVDGQRLIVRASDEDHKQIADQIPSIIEQLGNQGSKGVVRVYKTTAANSATLAQVISSVVPEATVTGQAPDQLTVFATSTEHERIRDLAQQLQTETASPDSSVRAYPLRGASAYDLMELLAADVRPENEVAVSSDSNRLIIRATEPEHKRLVGIVDKLVEQLTSTKKTGSVRVFELAETSGPNLVELLAPDLPPTASASISDDGERLIVRADDSDHDQIAAKIPNLIKQLGVAEKPFNKIYRPKVAELETVVDVFDDLFPRLLTAIDDRGQFVAVTATTDEHEQLQTMFEAMDQGTPSRPVPKSYALTNSDADSVGDSIRTLMRRNRGVAISVDREKNLLLVVAPQREQDLIGSIVSEFDSKDSQKAGNYKTELYGSSEMSYRSLEGTLQAALSQDAFVDADPYSQRVIVRASESDHAVAAETVKRLTDSLPKSDSRLSKIYQVTSADPEVVENIFEDIAPRSRAEADRDTNTVTVTASASEHAKMAQILQQLEQNVGSVPIPTTYKIATAEPMDVYNALTDLYDNDDVSVSWSPGSDSLLVVATPKWHEMVSQVVEQFNKSDGLASDKKLTVYSLKDIDGNAARDSIESLLEDETPAPRIEFDGGNNQFLVFATSKQHAMVKDALGRMKREQRYIEFFQLQANDAFSLELAIDGLFRDLPISASPQVDSNVEKQELIVRATQEQMQKVRELLSQMGESIRDPTRVENRRMRTMPFYGDVNATMKRIGELWPQMHSNELRIIYPADYDGGRLLKTLPKQESPTSVTPQTAVPADPFAPIPDEATPTNSPIPSRSPIPQQPESLGDSKARSDQLSANPSIVFAENETPTNGRTNQSATNAPPIVVIPNEGRLTISSDDPKALDEFEALLRLFAAPERSPTNDVAIFGLRNASATDTAQLLEDFFEEVPTWGRLGQVIIVPDARLNAIVVHANKSGREVVKEILTVLDAGEDEARANFSTPRIVPVRYSAATRILNVLQSIYKTQLSSGASRRKQVDIPSGIDSDVAAVLEQLNASSAGPLLTLEVDEATNSIIILGPPQLAEEVTGLIGQLDKGVKQADARGIRVISLKNIRSELLSDVLSELNSSN